jgi:isopentenyl phosphate kinase
MIIVKIGGSAITDKSKGIFNKAKIDKIDFVAKTISENLSDSLVLVHGVGSFGHPYVEKYDLLNVKNIEGIVKAHLSCKDLNTIVCRKLLEYGLKPFPVHPMTSFKIVNSNLVFDMGIFENALEEGMIPVVNADLVYNVDRRWFEIFSGDNIVLELAKKFEANRIGFATDVDGVLIDGEVADVITEEDVEKIGCADGKSDVTGGMREKVLKVLRSGLKAYVFNVTDLGSFLRGKSVGTLIKGTADLKES